MANDYALSVWGLGDIQAFPFLILIIGIFFAIEPKVYDRGVAWMLPMRYRSEFYQIVERVGFTPSPRVRLAWP